MQKNITTVTREVSAEEVAKAFGINVQQLEYKVATGEQLGMTTYTKVPLWRRLLSLFR